MSGAESPNGSGEPLVRIGELARRAGIPAATLRAWERRYAIVEPTRTEGGYRLYSREDERRLRSMLDLITRGVAPAEAASRVTADAAATPRATPRGASPPAPGLLTNSGELREGLLDALGSFDEVAAQRLLDSAMAAYTVDGLVTEVVLPVLRTTGERWAAGGLSVAQEHFSTSVIRSRMMSVARGWASGEGPSALLVCPPGEVHDIGLICFGLMLHERGWQISFLGADTPIETMREAALQIDPRVVVLSVTAPQASAALLDSGELGLRVPVMVAGAGAVESLAEGIGAELLADPIERAADVLTARFG